MKFYHTEGSWTTAVRRSTYDYYSQETKQPYLKLREPITSCVNGYNRDRRAENRGRNGTHGTYYAYESSGAAHGTRGTATTRL